MAEVAAQADRDATIYRAWVDGARQVDLAERYGVSQPAISQAIARYQATLPPTEKAAEIRRTLDLVDDLLAVYALRARTGHAPSNREVRGLLALKGRYLGIDRREVHITGEVDHYAHPAEPVPTVTELLERWRAEGKLTVRGELTRTDQEPAA